MTSAILCKSPVASRDGAMSNKGMTLLKEGDTVNANEMDAITEATEDVSAKKPASVKDDTGALEVFIITIW